MTKLFEIKAHMFQIYSKYEKYLKYIGRFVLALLMFYIINTAFGFMEELTPFYRNVMFAVVCCFLPQGATLFVAAGMVLMHLSVLSAAVALVTALLFAVVLFVYFRFSPEDMGLFAVTQICCVIGIPYVLPIATGLLKKGASVAALICSSVIYYFLEGIYQNINILQATAAGEDVESAKVAVAVGQMVENKEMYLMVGAFAITTMVVYIIRKTTLEHAWKIAIIVGAMIQMGVSLTGYIMFDITEKIIGVLVGNILAAAVGFLLEFLFMDLDYSRTERVQFEDDEYYYFVTAIPKKMVATADKTIMEFNGIPGLALKMKAKKKQKEQERQEGEDNAEL